jgi:hypothetical protein
MMVAGGYHSIDDGHNQVNEPKRRSLPMPRATSRLDATDWLGPPAARNSSRQNGNGDVSIGIASSGALDFSNRHDITVAPFIVASDARGRELTHRALLNGPAELLSESKDLLKDYVREQPQGQDEDSIMRAVRQDRDGLLVDDPRLRIVARKLAGARTLRI